MKAQNTTVKFIKSLRTGRYLPLNRAFKLFIVLSIAAMYVACTGDEPIPEVEIGDNRVDLRPQQTPIKDQGARGSCISFAAIAALEAAYFRMGYGEKDLSEEFLNYMGKNLWLHQDGSGNSLWAEIERKGTDGTENQMAAFSGGGSAGLVRQMYQNGMKVPYEADMPYLFDERQYASNPNYFTWENNAGKKQRDYSNFNLDTTNIPHRLLHAADFHGAATGKYYGRDGAQDPTMIESILKRKYEVAWDFSGRMVRDSIWRPARADESVAPIAHAMLIVGFDKTDPDPNKHYFIVKNSWGHDRSTRSGQGFTYISYEMVRQMGTAMAYIELPITNLKPWQELQVLGRYSLNFDGHEAMLDVYHLPGYWKEEDLGMPDRRLGSLYVGGDVFRVNGSIDGNKVTFYVNSENPNMRWDQLAGRKFEYYYSTDGFMAGFHTDPDGGQYAGYARKMGLWGGGIVTPRPMAPGSYEQSTWDAHLGGRAGEATLLLSTILPGPSGIEFPEFYELAGEYIEQDGANITSSSANFRISRPYYNRATVMLSSPVAEGLNARLDVGHLNHSPGVMAGYESSGDVPRPIVLIRK